MCIRDRLYSSQFAGVLPYVDYAIIGALFRGVSLCFALRILAEGDGRAYIFTETSSVIVGLVLNILGLHFYSYGGLGFSYVLWYGFYALLTWAVCRRRYGLRLNASFLALLLGAVALGLQPDEVMVIGDSLTKDILPAESAGFRTAWIKGPGWSADEDNASHRSETASLETLAKAIF